MKKPINKIIACLFLNRKKKLIEQTVFKPKSLIFEDATKIKENLLLSKINPNQEDFASFHFNRLYYESPEKIIELYNKEVEIGLTGEKLQILYLLIFHKLLLKHFDKSPILIIDNESIDVKGKIYLTQNSFEYETKSNLRIVKKL